MPSTCYRNETVCTQALGGAQIELGAKNAPRFALVVDAKIRKNAVLLPEVKYRERLLPVGEKKLRVWQSLAR